MGEEVCANCVLGSCVSLECLCAFAHMCFGGNDPKYNCGLGLRTDVFFWMCEHKLGVHLGSRTVWGGDSQRVYGAEVMSQNQVKALQQN